MITGMDLSAVPTVKLSLIRIDGGTQPRTAISEETVKEYADYYRQGVSLPPVDVFFDGAEYWLADGFHRYHGAVSIGVGSIHATVHNGTRRDAVLFSVSANQAHGMRRTNDDKRKAVMTLLQDDEWKKWSDNEIAKRCGVGQPFVSRERSSLIPEISERQAVRTYTTKHGTEATMHVEKIGRSSRAPSVQAEPAEPAPGWADPLESSSRRISDISDKEAESAMALRHIKRLYRTLTREDRQALKEWINEGH